MLKEFTDKIQKGACVALYAAGLSADGIIKYLKQNRPDVKIKYIFDAFKTGFLEDIEIKPLCDIYAYKDSFSLLVVTTRRDAHELNTIFNFYDIPYIRISKEIEQFHRLKPYIEKQKIAAEIFQTTRDKELYNLIWKTRLGSPIQELKDYTYKKYGISDQTPIRNYEKHYLEYINKDAIKIVFDCGFCNGIQALSFKKYMKNLKMIYAFEPMYEKFKEPNYDKLLKKEVPLKIVPFGVWNEPAELEFYENTMYKGHSRIAGTKEKKEIEKNEIVEKIKTTTIDITKEKEHIEKVDFIKMDVEGSEMRALSGGINTILKDRPQLAISIYHSNDDFVNIPLFLKEHLKEYTFRVEHYSYDLLETVLYAIPNELL